MKLVHFSTWQTSGESFDDTHGLTYMVAQVHRGTRRAHCKGLFNSGVWFWEKGMTAPLQCFATYALLCAAEGLKKPNLYPTYAIVKWTRPTGEKQRCLNNKDVTVSRAYWCFYVSAGYLLHSSSLRFKQQTWISPVSWSTSLVTRIWGKKALRLLKFACSFFIILFVWFQAC